MNENASMTLWIPASLELFEIYDELADFLFAHRYGWEEDAFRADRGKFFDRLRTFRRAVDTSDSPEAKKAKEVWELALGVAYHAENMAEFADLLWSNRNFLGEHYQETVAFHDELRNLPAGEEEKGTVGIGIGAGDVPKENTAGRAKEDARDQPDDIGLVTEPPDPTAYMGVTQITRCVWGMDLTIKAIDRILKNHPEIRHWKPSPKRKNVHLADFLTYLDSHRTGDDPKVIEARKVKMRELKSGE